ncbi:pyridoxal phosphate-dependent aminotransferase [Microvirgula aerodenitrificans]|uniref:pyridoxal phosphate-dependent aminotransferase n=1 Tax=Microvirgula aerodenitrificans TaxID=57480 RepID=UPI00248D48E6|nr:pyridoxal phosphate-dependent aminotransferase [Microvirgula aerodenitrificans]
MSLTHNLSLRHLTDVEERVAHYRSVAAPDAVNLSTAENVLLFDFYQAHLFDAARPFTAGDLRYPPKFYGSDAFRSSWAGFLNQAWGHGDLLTAQDVFAVGGTSAALECLAFILGTPGDVAISPAPLWYGFPWSFAQRPRVSFVPFDLLEKGIDKFELTLEDVKRACLSVQPQPKFLVLTNPRNPLGGNYSPETLNAIYKWVLEETRMHIISDEIYFFSQVGGGEPFVPAFALDAVREAGEDGRERVHAVWGLAKDFGMSGFKVGFVISRNQKVHALMSGDASLRTMAWFTPFDSLKYRTLAPLFLDGDGLPDPALAQQAMQLYAGPEASSLLGTQYAATREALASARLKFLDHNSSAIFFWLDLREFLDRVPPPDGSERQALHKALHPDIDPREERLSEYITASSGVSLIPGQECFSREPGFFRMCYTAEPKDRVVKGIERMGRSLHALLTPQRVSA